MSMMRRTFMKVPALAALFPQSVLAESEPDNRPLTPELIEQIGDEMLPADHKYPPCEAYDENLRRHLAFKGICTVQELRNLIGQFLEVTLQREQETLSHGRGTVYLHVGLIRQ